MPVRESKTSDRFSFSFSDKLTKRAMLTPDFSKAKIKKKSIKMPDVSGKQMFGMGALTQTLSHNVWKLHRGRAEVQFKVRS